MENIDFDKEFRILAEKKRELRGKRREIEIKNKEDRLVKKKQEYEENKKKHIPNKNIFDFMTEDTIEKIIKGAHPPTYHPTYHAIEIKEKNASSPMQIIYICSYCLGLHTTRDYYKHVCHFCEKNEQLNNDIKKDEKEIKKYYDEKILIKNLERECL